MSRHARLFRPGAVHHVIARFAWHAFRLAGRRERSDYLRRLGTSLALSDWKLLGYALMSSHVHLVAVAGSEAVGRLTQRVHVGFATATNARDQSLGPVFAGRPTVIVVGDAAVGRLLAYVHNNPVRAGLVADALGSSWTSHRAYAGLARSPGYLDVSEGLRRAGFDATDAGRAAFLRDVAARAGSPRDPDLTAASEAVLRRTVRAWAGRAIEPSSAELGCTGDLDALVRDLLVPDGALVRRPWIGDLGTLVEHSAAAVGVGADVLRSPARTRVAVRGRRIALRAGFLHLGRSLTTLAACFALSVANSSRLVSRPAVGVDPTLDAAVAAVVEACRAAPA